MNKESKNNLGFDFEGFQLHLEQKVAQMRVDSHPYAEFNFTLRVRTESSHQKHLKDRFTLHQNTRLGAHREVALPNLSQECFFIGEVDFWDVVNYRKTAAELHVMNTQHKKYPALRSYCPGSTYRSQRLLGKHTSEGKLFITEEQNVLIILANMLALVKNFKERRASASVRDLDYFSQLFNVRRHGHLISVASSFDRIPPVYCSESSLLEPACEQLEALVTHLTPTVNYHPL